MRYGWVATRGGKFIGACLNEFDENGQQHFRVRKWLKDMAGRADMFIASCNTREQLRKATGLAVAVGLVPQDRPKHDAWGRR